MCRSDSARPDAVRLARLLDKLEKPRPDAPAVGDEVGDAKRLAIARPEHDVHRSGSRPAPARLLQLERELELPRQLRVRDLAPPVRLPLDEVRTAARDEAIRLADTGNHAKAQQLLRAAAADLDALWSELASAQAEELRSAEMRIAPELYNPSSRKQIWFDKHRAQRRRDR
jgi:hypothetical protein